MPVPQGNRPCRAFGALPKIPACTRDYTAKPLDSGTLVLHIILISEIAP